MQSYKKFPQPPPSRIGWPWTHTPEHSCAVNIDNKPWPKITIVTPSFNQGRFIEETIRSILLQEYPNLEYIIIDGGSTDNTVEIIKKYAPWLKHWSSEPDKGQAHAVNKGLTLSSGDWLTWLNSDDFYLPGSLWTIAETALRNNLDWISGDTLSLHNYEIGMAFNETSSKIFHPRKSSNWLDYLCIRKSGIYIPQPSTFWSRNAWNTCSRLDETLHYAMDVEYWSRLAYHGFSPFIIDVPIAVFRKHLNAKTALGKLPFWKEELRIARKWLCLAPTTDDRLTLRKYCRWLYLQIIEIQLRAMISKIRILSNIAEKYPYNPDMTLYQRLITGITIRWSRLIEKNKHYD